MIRFRSSVHTLVFALLALLTSAWPAHAQFSITSPTTSWNVVPYPAGIVTDYFVDQQTGSGEADIVGGGLLPSFYTQYIPGGTPNTGTIYFRMRLGADDSPNGFKGACFLGVDANADGKLDVFFGVDNSGSSNGIYIWAAGNNLNISPSTTSIDSNNPLYSSGITASNYNWVPVTVTNDPAANTAALLNTDGRTGAGQNDHFLSFSIPFSSVVTALNTAGVTGVTENTSMRYVMGTATQANSFNQDLNGVNGGVNSSLTWADLGAITTPLNVTGTTTNVAPLNVVPGAQSVAMNGTVAISGISVSDADGNLSTVRLTATQGTVQVSLVGGATITAGASGSTTLTLSGTQAQINAALGTVTFNPNTNYSGGASITILSTDSSAATDSDAIAITVQVNQPPEADNDTATTFEDTPTNFSVLSNDSDADGGVLSVTNASVDAASGLVSVNPDKTLTFTPALNFHGTATISYSISDGQGGTDSATVTVTVTPVNDNPIVGADTASTSEDIVANIAVLTNDSDVDGDILSITVASVSSTQGTVAIISGTTLTFTPAANFHGPATITYTITDGKGGTASTTVAVTVTSLNDAPVAVNDVDSTNEDVATTVAALVNDIDADADALSITAASVASAEGSVVVNGGNTITFTPAANFHGSAVISYSITDGNGGISSATITISVIPTNDAPIAVNDTATTAEDTATTITVLTNDSDLDGDVLSVTSASVPATEGTVVANANGTLTYSPAPDFHGSTTISYSISDGNGGTASATVTVTVTPVNDAPVAINDTTSTARATNKTFAVLGNDFDVEGDTLRVTGASVSAAQGSVVVNADSTLTFTPLNTFTGAASITYFITDDQGGSASAIATVNVLDGNQPPVAVADSSSTNEDVAQNINVLGNDSDPDSDPLSVTSATIAPTQGTVAVNADKTLLYTPAPNFHGTATISYTISDGSDGTNSAQVTVTVAPLNDEPVAVNDVTSTPEDTAKTIAVLANDSDVDDDTIVIVTASVPPLEGAVTVNPDGTITFTPALNFTGNTTVQYTISDGTGGSAAASVLVTVTPVNDAPVAVNDAAMTPEDAATTANVLGNDSDADGDALTVTTANVAAAEGAVVINAGQTLTFTPATNFHGTAVVSYSISDGQGGSDSATLTVTVNPTNDAPVAVNDSATTEEEIAITVAVLSNDSDVDEDELSVSAASVVPAQGSVSINAGGTLTFTPAAQFHGTATINYSIADGHGGTSSAIVTVTVTPKNDAPVAVNDIDSTGEDTAKILNVLVNDSDVDGDTLVITTATIEPAQGSVVINPDQTLTFTPAANFQGSAVISYSITDGNGGISSATVTVEVTPANDAPVAVNDTAQTAEDVPVTIDVLANDSDTDGDTLVISNAAVPPNQGTISIAADGKLVFVPVTNFNGTAMASYEVSDGNGGTATAVVTIVVDPVNDAPVAVNDSGTTPQGRPIVIDVLTNDTDTEGQPLSVTGAELKSGSGAVTVQSDGSVEFTPAPGLIGTATISYVADDGAGGTATAFITVTVDGLPIALNDQAGTAVNASVTIAVLANDGDPEGLPLTVTGVTISELQGSVVINPDGTVTFTPASGLAGAVSFPYVVMDAAGNTASATVNVTVGNGNATSPVAVTDYATTVLQTPVNISVLANDLNPGGGTLSVTTATVDSASGSVLMNADGTLTFTAASGFSGSATIVYTIASTSGGTATGQVFVDVSPGNAAPLAAPDFATATTGIAKVLFVLTNDSDPDEDVLSIVSASVDPIEGTVTVNPDGTLTYVSTPAFAGQAHLVYTIRDDSGSEASSTVTVTVAATQQNQAPVAVNDAARGSVDLPMDARVLLNDSDADGDPLIVTAVTVIEGAGTATINPDGSVHFVPATGFNDIARISYTVSDGNGGTDTGILTINVNDDPVAVTDNVQTTPQTAVTVAVLANDSDPNGNPLSLVAGSTSPTDGSIVLNPNGTLTFTPNNGFTGTAVVFYTITDGKGGSAEGTVNIAVNTAPQLAPDFGSTVLGQPLILVVLPNDTDPDGDTLSVIGATVDPVQGTVEINPDGTLTFTPAATFSGPAVITYTVQDSRGGTSSTTATISRANSTPTADAREVYTYCGTSLMINPMRTAADIDGDSLTVLSVSKPSKGSATIQSNGYILYKPGTMFRGLVTDSFVVTLSDGQGGTTQELITVRSFQQIAGTFQGLLTESSPSQLSASQVSGPSAPAYRGRITATLNGRAAFTARLELDGKVARFTGTLTGALQATRRLKIDGKTVTVALKYHDLTDSWSANIDGDAISIRGESCVFRLAKSGRNRSSTYQVSMATSGSAALASAEGSAIARVRSSGAATMVGTLPDGSKFSVGSRTNAHAGLSVYRWLGQGAASAPVLGGVLELQGVAKDALSGELSWQRPASEVAEILSVTGAIQ